MFMQDRSVRKWRSIDELQPHPMNYVRHPPEQLRHLRRSIELYGVYRPVVISRDCFILAGHAVVQVLREMGISEVECVEQPFDHDDALARKLIAADNEIQRLRIVDDRRLVELADSFAATGYDGSGLEAAIVEALKLRLAPTYVPPEQRLEQSDWRPIVDTIVERSGMGEDASEFRDAAFTGTSGAVARFVLSCDAASARRVEDWLASYSPEPRLIKRKRGNLPNSEIIEYALYG